MTMRLAIGTSSEGSVTRTTRGTSGGGGSTAAPVSRASSRNNVPAAFCPLPSLRRNAIQQYTAAAGAVDSEYLIAAGQHEVLASLAQDRPVFVEDTRRAVQFHRPGRRSLRLVVYNGCSILSSVLRRCCLGLPSRLTKIVAPRTPGSFNWPPGAVGNDNCLLHQHELLNLHIVTLGETAEIHTRGHDRCIPLHTVNASPLH